MPLLTDKKATSSTTLQGLIVVAIVGLVPLIARLTGWDSLTDLLNESAITNVVALLFGLGGALWSTLGRRKIGQRVGGRL